MSEQNTFIHFIVNNVYYELSQSTKPKIGYVGDNEYLLQNLLKFKPQNNPFSTNTWIK